jgi:hypothetical protein
MFYPCLFGFDVADAAALEERTEEIIRVLGLGIPATVLLRRPACARPLKVGLRLGRPDFPGAVGVPNPNTTSSAINQFQAVFPLRQCSQVEKAETPDSIREPCRRHLVLSQGNAFLPNLEAFELVSPSLTAPAEK